MDTAPSRIWVKSSYSGHNNNCVEFLTPPPPDQAVIRDSKDPDRRMIAFRAASWVSFMHACRTDGLTTATPR